MYIKITNCTFQHYFYNHNYTLYTISYAEEQTDRCAQAWSVFPAYWKVKGYFAGVMQGLKSEQYRCGRVIDLAQNMLKDLSKHGHMPLIWWPSCGARQRTPTEHLVLRHQLVRRPWLHSCRLLNKKKEDNQRERKHNRNLSMMENTKNETAQCRKHLNVCQNSGTW